MRTSTKISKDIEFRLSVYEKALKDYETKYHPNTIRGFCLYFSEEFQIDVYREKTFKEILPELFEQKQDGSMFGWWFAPGDVVDRIECLKKAIELIKLKIIKNEK